MHEAERDELEITILSPPTPKCSPNISTNYRPSVQRYEPSELFNIKMITIASEFSVEHRSVSTCEEAVRGPGKKMVPIPTKLTIIPHDSKVTGSNIHKVVMQHNQLSLD